MKAIREPEKLFLIGLGGAVVSPSGFLPAGLTDSDPIGSGHLIFPFLVFYLGLPLLIGSPLFLNLNEKPEHQNSIPLRLPPAIDLPSPLRLIVWAIIIFVLFGSDTLAI
jgi:hypothetical protein